MRTFVPQRAAAVMPAPVTAARDDACEREAERVAAEPAMTRVRSAGAAPAGSGGTPLDPATRTAMEARFGHDFGRVRVHADRSAAQASAALGARGFTIGGDVYFAAGAYAPGTASGRALLAHELTHTLQQARGAVTVQRAPAPSDPLCDTFHLPNAIGALFVAVTSYLGTKDTAERLAVIRAVKPILRCASPTEQADVRTDLADSLGTETAAIWSEAGTALGGYSGVYPRYATDLGTRMREMGVSETTSVGTFSVPGKGPAYRRRAGAAARAAAPSFAKADIVYFRGHQYAQYRAPGAFTEVGDASDPGFDLRYLDAKGFANVKLMVATSCATLCSEALSLFTNLFPNAAIIGYRRGRSIGGGDAIRLALGSRIRALKRPLLLEEAVDIGAILSAWESVVESRHKGNTELQPGHFSGGVLRFWDGAAWDSIDPMDPANACERHGVRADMVGPR